MNLRTLGNNCLVYGLATLCFASQCSQEIMRRNAKIESQPTTKQMQEEQDSSVNSMSVEKIIENASYYDSHENEVYKPFGSKETYYEIRGWKKDKVLNERDKAYLSYVYRGLGSEGMGSFNLK